MFNKYELVEQILSKLNSELSTITDAAKAAHDAATHEESKSEDKHDTRGLEASYLAGAQASRAVEIKRLINNFKYLPIRQFEPNDPIAPGAIVELDFNGRRSLYFLVKEGGGMSIQLNQRLIQVIAVLAPLGDAMVGRRVGDWIEIEREGTTREFQIASIY